MAMKNREVKKAYRLMINGKRYTEYTSIQRAFKKAKSLHTQNADCAYYIHNRKTDRTLMINVFLMKTQEERNFSQVDRLAA